MANSISRPLSRYQADTLSTNMAPVTYPADTVCTNLACASGLNTTAQKSTISMRMVW
ncbi:hypothetical protein D3C72_2382890 [compost metagenome]